MHNIIPSSIPIIGREAELDRIATLLSTADCRLLTLTGIGGIGKTRLALEIIHQQGLNFPDGIYFIPLQALDSDTAIISTMADILDFTIYDKDDSEDALIQFLKNKSLLLVIDNFEHLLSATTLLSEILAHTSHVKILVTSRERLNLREEWVIDVGGLSFPVDTSNPSADGDYAAIQLFEYCARRTAYRPVATDYLSIARICQLVEGTPLAIELAASWIHVLTCEQIATEIEHNLDILSTRLRNIPERHRSIRAIFDYTWQQMSPSQQRIFTALSVFRGGWTLAALQAVVDTSLSDLQTLVDKSLIRLRDGKRYEIHKLLRQYAAEKLDDTATVNQIRDAHSRYYLEFLHVREADIKGRKQLSILDEIEADLENIYTAWRWAVEAGEAEAIRKATSTLFLFAEMRAREIEVDALFGRAQERFNVDHFPQLWAKITVRRTRLIAMGPFNIQVHREPIDRCLDIAAQFEDATEIALCKLTLYIFYPFDEETEEPLAEAVNLLHEAYAIYQKQEDAFFIARTLKWLGIATFDVATRLAYQLKGRQIAVAAGIPNVSVLGLAPIGTNYFLLARYADSASALQEGIERVVAIGDKKWRAWTLQLLARTEFFNGHFSRVEELYHEQLRTAFQLNHSLQKLWRLILEGLRHIIDPTIPYDLDALSDALYNVGDHFWYEKISAGIIRIIVAYMRDDKQLARTELPLVLDFCVRKSSLPDQIVCLMVIAMLMADDGEYTYAAELMGLLLTHRGCPHGWFDQWILLTEKQAQLQAELGFDSWHEAWEQGKKRKLDDVIAAHLEAPFSPMKTALLQANQQLIEPLTERELEILQAIADGLKSSEIAEKLILSVGTIRWYRKRIYSKLQVNSRSEVIATAKQMNLLI